MQRLRRIFHHGFAGLVGALLVLPIGVFGFFFTTANKLVRWSHDLPYTYNIIPERKPKADVCILNMDDESYGILQQSRLGAWDRSLHARTLNLLKAQGAKAAVFDIVFSDAVDKQADEEFAKAIKNFGNVILGADVVQFAQDRTLKADGGAKGKQIQAPYEPLQAEAATIGLVEMDPDDDGYIRKFTAIDPTEFYRPMAFAAAELVEASITKDTNSWTHERFINYYGIPGTIPWASYYRLLITNEFNGLPPNFFKGKVVFIGYKTLTKKAGEKQDQYFNPYTAHANVDDPRRFMQGTEIHATMFANFVEGTWMVRMPPPQELTIILLVGALFGFGLVQLRPIFAIVASLIGLAVVAGLTYALLTQTLQWYAWLLVVIEIGVACAWSVIFNSVVYWNQQQLLTQSMSMYVSPALAKQVIKADQNFTKPGAVKQELSILFSDIANFTSMSEGMDTDELATLMNNYFENAVNNCIQKTDGTVVKYIGDAIFAIWNAPVPQPNHHEQACQGAIYLRDNITEFKFKVPKPGLEVRTRIGLHCGSANVGNFGSSKRVDYTALGENINLASRMEGLNKYIGTSVVITGDLEEKIRGKFITRFIGRFVLKGFGKPVNVHELLTRPDKAEESRPWREAFTEAQKKFWARDWDGAVEGFKKVLAIKPKDGPSNFFLKHIEELRATPPGEDWQGQIEMHEK